VAAYLPRGTTASGDVRRANEVEIGMDRTQKSETVAELNRTFSETSVVIITRNLGLTVAQSTDLRTKMRDAGARYKVAKNRLARIAIEGTSYTGLSDLLTGPTALSTSADPVAPAKVIVDFAKTNDKLEIVGGAMGETILDVNGVKSLATLPSLDELRAKIVGLIVAPATKLATITQAPAAQLARVLSAYAEKEAA
jgi:large subunit ribosomal protein L10